MSYKTTASRVRCCTILSYGGRPVCNLFLSRERSLAVGCGDQEGPLPTVSPDSPFLYHGAGRGRVLSTIIPVVRKHGNICVCVLFASRPCRPLFYHSTNGGHPTCHRMVFAPNTPCASDGYEGAEGGNTMRQSHSTTVCHSRVRTRSLSYFDR